MSSGIIDHLVEVMRRADPGDLDITRYSVPDDRERLWLKLEENGGRLQSSTFTIVYDGQCDRTSLAFRPEHWLTPWDWAMALSAHLYHSPDDLPPGGASVLILDLSPPDWGHSGRIRFKSVGAFAPWIRWYRTGGGPLAHDFDVLFGDLKSLSSLPKLDRTALTSTDVRALMTTWMTMFTAPRDRHAIGNLVAPMILAEGLLKTRGLRIDLPTDQEDGNPGRVVPVLERFRQMVQCLEPPRKTSTSPAPRPLVPERAVIRDPKLDVLHSFQRLRIVLVDDQYALGYHTVLSRLLFGDEFKQDQHADGLLTSWTRDGYDYSVFSTARPDVLLDWIRRATDAYDGHLRHIEDVDILMLDLRLFGDSKIDESSPAEKDFLTRLIDVCQAAGVLERESDLTNAVAAARQRINNGRETLRELTLLPLLLRRIDPSLPIVLFSSTHQREVVDIFRDYPNVITTFAKPIISGYAAEGLAVESARDLESALLEGFRLHKVRNLWQLTCSLAAATSNRSLPKRVWERNLDPVDGSYKSYYVGPQFATFLAGEYLHLILRGRFCDALQLPDNLLEQVGGQFEPPRSLRKFDIVMLSTLKLDPNEKWEAAIGRGLKQTWNRSRIWSLIQGSLRSMASRRKQDAIAAHLNTLAGAIRILSDQDTMTFDQLVGAPKMAANAIEGEFGSLEAAISLGLDQTWTELPAEVGRLIRSLESVADFQFYALLGALRNARSHFRCRPFEHDRSVEDTACWSWWFFIRSLTILIARGQPIRPGLRPSSADVRSAVEKQWLPGRRFINDVEGAEHCDGVIARFGHLLRLNILRLDEGLVDLGEYPLALARKQVN
jgi:hypothetical protein